MNSYTRAFLVLLRLAIGWHLLVEGIEKIESVHRGPTELGRPWSSEIYLREATGPLADFFKAIPGDPDQELLAKLAMSDETAEQPRLRLAKPLVMEWSNHLERFSAHYQLNGDQLVRATQSIEEAQDRLADWLVKGKKDVEKSFPSGKVSVPMTTRERIAEYHQKVLALQDALKQEMPAFEQDVLKSKLAALKADVRRLRTDLNADLNQQREDAFKKVLAELTPEQKQKDALPVAKSSNWRLWFVDQVTMWGLTISGACLILGLFTRTACLGGAGLLCLFYLAMPALPGVPDNPRSEGHYFVINKNVIEMLALLALATTKSGEWVGLDGLIRYLNPFRGRSKSQDVS